MKEEIEQLIKKIAEIKNLLRMHEENKAFLGKAYTVDYDPLLEQEAKLLEELYIKTSQYLNEV